MRLLLEWLVSVSINLENDSLLLLFSQTKENRTIVSDWGESTPDKVERQIAPIIDGEDWDREAHVGHLFNEEELRQLNG